MSAPDLPSPLAVEEIFRVAAALPAAQRCPSFRSTCSTPERHARDTWTLVKVMRRWVARPLPGCETSKYQGLQVIVLALGG